MNRAKWWVISDTHFGHNKLVELCGRPEDFSDRILANIERMVKPSDVLIHLGDVTWGTIPKFPCKTILVRGNHDAHKYKYYMNKGFDFACDSFSLKYGGVDILFTHKPALFHEHDLNVHGHLHNVCEVKSVCPHYLVSLEYTNYEPILLDRIIAKYRKDHEDDES